MRIKITQEDIAAGQRWTVHACPVALAAARAAGWYAEVSRKGIMFHDGSLRSYALPDCALNAIIAYDRTGLMLPFEFELDESAVQAKPS